eukprot:TRINITY_DN6922_c0_g4_i1.p1 TRINITY_DN6922_c0_g4~~TRINITY_DN6922_c0_g4_i1.p1  ORF type:complete len:522 (+),score=71.97 TRINITY_DN6922_c0_g4_i1:223-1566(+)
MATSLSGEYACGTAWQPVDRQAVWPCGGDANGYTGSSGDRRGRPQGGSFAMAAGSSGGLVGEVVRDDVRSRSAKIWAEVDTARRADRDRDSGWKDVGGLHFTSPPLPLAGLELSSPPLPQRRPRSSSSSPDGEERRFCPSYRWDSTSPRHDGTLPRRLWSRTPSPVLGEQRTWRSEGGVGQGYDHSAISHIGGSCRYVYSFVDGGAVVDTDGTFGVNLSSNIAPEHVFDHEVVANRVSPACVVVASPIVDCSDTSLHVWEISTRSSKNGGFRDDEVKATSAVPFMARDEKIRGSDPCGGDEFIKQEQDAAHVECCPAPPSEVASACFTMDSQASTEAATCAGLSVTLKTRPDTVTNRAGGCAAESPQPMAKFALVDDGDTSVGVAATSDAHTHSTGPACRQQRCKNLIYTSFLFGDATGKESNRDLGGASDALSKMKQFLPGSCFVK